MSATFEPRQGLIIAPFEVWGPAGSAVLRLALDTGATFTVLSIAMLVAVGYDPALSPTGVQVTTGSGVEYAPRVTLSRIRGLGLRSLDIYPLDRFTLIGIILVSISSIEQAVVPWSNGTLSV